MKILPTISGFGYYVPPRIVTNEELATFVDTTPEWIVTRTGIEQRRFIEPTVQGSDLAYQASLLALSNAGRTASELTHIIFATCTPESHTPPSACTLEAQLGIHGCTAFDVNAVCSGFMVCLDIARAYIAMNPSACILLAAAETLSDRCNWEDRTTSILFGDGAGAAIITGKDTPAPSKQPLFQATLGNIKISSDGSLGNLLRIENRRQGTPYTLGSTITPDFFINMQGREVFKHAVKSMSSICLDLLHENNMTIDDIDVFVPHQANLRIIEAVGSRLDIPLEKVYINVNKYGNTSAASIPIAIGEALQEGKIKPGHTVLLTSFGGGFSWGAGLLKF